MKLKSIQTAALITLGAIIVTATILRVFDSAETVMYSFIWLGLAAACVTANDFNI